MTKVPEGWAETTIGDVARFERCVTYKKAQARTEPEGGYLPLLRATNIDHGELLLDEEMVYVPASVVSAEQRLRPGDTVIATSSGSARVVGKSARLTMRWEGTFGAFCGVLRAESVESSYLGYFVQSESVRTTWSAAAGGTNINNLKRSDIETTRLLLPPVPEQHRIVAAIEEQFSRLDAGVASLQRAKRNLQRMRASVLTVAVEGRLVEPDADPGAAAAFIEAIRGERAARPPSRRPPAATTEDDDAAAPPAGWTSAALSDLSAVEPHAITDGPFGSNLKTEHYTESGPRVIRLQNIGDGRFVDDEAHISLEHFQRLSAHNVEAGDLLIALLGSELPRCCLVPPHVPPAIVKADCVRFRIHPRVNGRFLNLFLNSPPLRRRVSSRLHGVGRPRLNLGEIRSIQIPVPSAAEQQRIVEEVDRQFSVLEAMETALNSGLARAEGLRQAILREAFAGRLVPQDPSDEPASALLKSIGKEVTE